MNNRNQINHINRNKQSTKPSIGSRTRTSEILAQTHTTTVVKIFKKKGRILSRLSWQTRFSNAKKYKMNIGTRVYLFCWLYLPFNHRRREFILVIFLTNFEWFFTHCPSSNYPSLPTMTQQQNNNNKLKNHQINK